MKQKFSLFSMFFASIFLLGSLTSCSKDKKPNPSAPLPKKIETASAPAVTYSYDFKPREFCEGYCNKFQKFEVCETVQSFENEKELCAGLKNAPLNNFCARKERAQLYAERCGGNFEEVGLKGFTRVVNDARKGSCSYTIPESTSSEYCAHLVNEDEHAYCGWEDRRILFKQYNCPSTFSKLPEEDLVVSHGAEVLSETNSSMSEKTSIVRTVFRKTFKIQTPTVATILQFVDIVLREENCEVEGQAYFSGGNVSIPPGGAHEAGTGSPSSVIALSMMSDINLLAKHSYEITVEVNNPGLCQDFEYAYTLLLTPK